MAATLEPVPFRFDHDAHEYSIAGKTVPHITGMLLKVGAIDDTWFTEEACDRGIAVHDLTAAYDLGALDARDLVSNYKGYVLAHVAVMQLLRPTWKQIEEPDVHPKYRFGGRPDRVGLVHRLHTVYEIKSGGKERSHQIQTALQAILVSWRSGLPAKRYQRIAGYYKRNGRYSLEPHKDERDFDRAFAIIKECCK